jgi:hypothetical protein
MLKHLKAALKDPSLDAVPTQEEAAMFFKKPAIIPDDVREEGIRRGNPFEKKKPGMPSIESRERQMVAMNRANSSDKMSEKTRNELERLRRQKLAG